MNLQVNLILDTERRSGSAVSLQFVMRVVVIGVPVLCAVLLAILFLGVRSSRQTKLNADQEKSQVEPMFHAVTALQKDLTDCRTLNGIFDGWRNSRRDWSNFLLSLQMIVPENIQLTHLIITETIDVKDNAPVRLSAMRISGLVGGERPEIEVERFNRNLKTVSAFTSIVENAEVKKFDMPTESEYKDQRIFDIECKLFPKKAGN